MEIFENEVDARGATLRWFSFGKDAAGADLGVFLAGRGIGFS
jgi:hypothetical protein